MQICNKGENMTKNTDFNIGQEVRFVQEAGAFKVKMNNGQGNELFIVSADGEWGQWANASKIQSTGSYIKQLASTVQQYMFKINFLYGDNSQGYRLVVTENRHALINASCITSTIVKFKGQNYGHDIKEPLQTVTAQGNPFALTNAFLTKYYGSGENATSINNPMPTATTKDRFSLVNISFANTDLTDEQKYTAWTIVRMLEHFADLKTNCSVLPGPRVNAIVLGDKIVTDISLRMLNPKELFRGQGFPEDYIIDAEHNGKPLPKTAQVRMCGNSVPPHLAYHIFKSNVA